MAWEPWVHAVGIYQPPPLARPTLGPAGPVSAPAQVPASQGQHLNAGILRGDEGCDGEGQGAEEAPSRVPGLVSGGLGRIHRCYTNRGLKGGGRQLSQAKGTALWQAGRRQGAGVLEKSAFPSSHENVQPETRAWSSRQYSFRSTQGVWVQMDTLVFNAHKGKRGVEFAVNLSPSSATDWLHDLEQAISPF